MNNSFKELWSDYVESEDWLDADSCLDEMELAEEWFRKGEMYQQLSPELLSLRRYRSFMQANYPAQDAHALRRLSGANRTELQEDN